MPAEAVKQNPLYERASIGSIESLKSLIKIKALEGKKKFNTEDGSVLEIQYSPFKPATQTDEREPEKFSLTKTKIADLTKVGKNLGKKEEIYSVTVDMVSSSIYFIEDQEAYIKVNVGKIPEIEGNISYEGIMIDYFDILLYASKSRLIEAVQNPINSHQIAHEGLIQKLLLELSKATPI